MAREGQERGFPLAGEARKEVQYKHSINCTLSSYLTRVCTVSDEPLRRVHSESNAMYAPDKFQPVIELNSCLVLSRREAINALSRPTPDTRIPHRFFLPRISCASNLQSCVYI